MDNGYFKILKPLLALTVLSCGAALIFRSNQSKLDREISLKELTGKISTLRMSHEEADLMNVPIYTSEEEYSRYMKLFLESVSDTFVARSAAFYVGGSKLSLQSAVPNDEYDNFHKDIAMGEGILGKILQTGKTILVESFNEITERPDYLKEPSSDKRKGGKSKQQTCIKVGTKPQGG